MGNEFPTSNDPTQEAVNQENYNLSALGAAIVIAKNAVLAAITALNNLSQAAILDDATPFHGASIAAIKAKTDLIVADLATQLDTNIPAIKTMTDKVGTITNTGGTATLGSILGDFANVTLLSKLTNLLSFLTNGSGSALPSNKSLYDELVAWLNNGGGVLPATTSLYDSVTWKQHANATLSQVTPTQNQYYTILAATSNVVALGIFVAVATTGETLQVRLTIDGQLYTGSVAATAASTYYATLGAGGTITLSTTVASTLFASQYVEGRSVTVEVEKTTASGTGTLTGQVMYQTR